MRKALIGISLLGTASCFPLTFSGSNVPTEHTFQLTAADIEAGASDECRLDWVGPDPAQNRDQALQELEKRGVEIVERKILKFATAFRHKLHVQNGFWEKPVFDQSMTLTHELIHYCQRDKQGDGEFERAYAHSAGRWRVETPAYAQSITTAVAQGAGSEQVATYINKKLKSMQEFYFLFDIDPSQYETETRRIWEEAAQLN